MLEILFLLLQLMVRLFKFSYDNFLNYNKIKMCLFYTNHQKEMDVMCLKFDEKIYAVTK